MTVEIQETVQNKQKEAGLESNREQLNLVTELSKQVQELTKELNNIKERKPQTLDDVFADSKKKIEDNDEFNNKIKEEADYKYFVENEMLNHLSLIKNYDVKMGHVVEDTINNEMFKEKTNSEKQQKFYKFIIENVLSAENKDDKIPRTAYDYKDSSPKFAYDTIIDYLKTKARVTSSTNGARVQHIDSFKMMEKINNYKRTRQH